MEPRYNKVLGTMKITLFYQVSHYIRVKKQRNIKSWDQQNYLVIRGFCYIRPLYNKVPLYFNIPPLGGGGGECHEIFSDVYEFLSLAFFLYIMKFETLHMFLQQNRMLMKLVIKTNLIVHVGQSGILFFFSLSLSLFPLTLIFQGSLEF